MKKIPFICFLILCPISFSAFAENYLPNPIEKQFSKNDSIAHAESFAVCAASYAIAAEKREKTEADQLKNYSKDAELATWAVYFLMALPPLNRTMENFDEAWNSSKTLSDMAVGFQKKLITYDFNHSTTSTHRKTAKLKSTLEVCLLNLENQKFLVDIIKTAEVN